MKTSFIIIAAIILIALPAFVFLRNTPNTPTSLPYPSPTQTQPTAATSSYAISTGQVPNIPFQLPPDYTIHVFAKDLGSPRDLQFSPGGTLLVSDPGHGRVFALPD